MRSFDVFFGVSCLKTQNNNNSNKKPYKAVMLLVICDVMTLM